MDLSGSRLIDAAKTLGQRLAGATSSNSKDSSGLVEQAVQKPSENPDSSGVVASSQVENGKLRDAMDQRETRDRSSIAQLIRHLSENVGGPGNIRLAIDVDVETDETTFLIISRSTGDVLKTVPPEDMLPLLRELHPSRGALIDHQV